MKATITIDMDGAAFEDRRELFEVLSKAAFDIYALPGTLSSGTIRDTNGNTCGRFEITED